jgi:GNAT superfamily N-acetyltransferase
MSSGSHTEIKALTEGWQIRGARQADAAELARLSGLLGYPSDASAMRGRLSELLGAADHRIVVAAPLWAAARSLGGWMHVARHQTLESGAFAEILGLIVDAEARRAGVGRAMVAEAERWARVQRVPRLTVRSNVTRSEAHRFYPALGFSHSKSQQVYSKALGAGAGAVA